MGTSRPTSFVVPSPDVTAPVPRSATGCSPTTAGAAACTATSRTNQLPAGLLIRVTGDGRFCLCRLHRIHAWQQLAHLRKVAGDAVLLAGELVDLAVGRSAAAFGISVDLGEQLLGLGLGPAGDLAGVL